MGGAVSYSHNEVTWNNN